MRFILQLSSLLSVLVCGQLFARQGCMDDYELCLPPGATTGTLPPVGPGLDNLYTDVVDAINNPDDSVTATNAVTNDGPAKRRGSPAFCCALGAHCLLLQDFGIPMCWDRFTTNFFFPDGSFGTIVTGNFTPADGGNVDLVYGTYTLTDGTTGNIYNSSLTTEVPLNTFTMPMPTPWTSTGVGTAIPASELGTTGILSTVTTVVSGSRASATFPSLTIIATMSGCGHCWGNATTITGITVAGPTYPATTRIFTTGILTPPVLNKGILSYDLKVTTVAMMLFWLCRAMTS